MFPEKLKRGADFKQSVIESIDRIIDYLHSTRITVDNRTLSMQQNSAGITLSARPAVKMRRSETPVAIPAYNGYFTIIDASEYDEEGNVTGFFVQVVYGMHPDVSYCGITDVGDVPRSEKISIQPSGVISIGVHVINMAESPTKRDYRLCAAREDDTSWIPDDAPEGALTAYWEIGTVRVVDGEIIIDQIWQDGKIYFSRNYYV